MLNYIFIVILLAFSAFFSGSEIAYSSANIIRLRHIAENGGGKKDKAALDIALDYDSALTTILIGNNLVNIDVLRVIRWIGLEPSVNVPGRDKKMTVYGFHSLRHSFCSFCAEAGVPKAVLLSILGTQSDIADKYYTHVGDAAQREAINAISGISSHDTLKERVQKVLDLLDSKPEPTQELLNQIKNILK